MGEEEEVRRCLAVDYLPIYRPCSGPLSRVGSPSRRPGKASIVRRQDPRDGRAGGDMQQGTADLNRSKILGRGTRYRDIWWDLA